MLVGRDGFPPECFPDSKGPLSEHNDAQILAEVMAKGGVLLITSDTTFVEEVRMARWFKDNKERLELKSQAAVWNADELYVQWGRHPGADRAFTKTALGAFWPEEARAGVNAVRTSVEEGIERMIRGGQLARFGRYLRSTLQHSKELPQLMEEVRGALPEKTRGAERRRQEIVFGRKVGRNPEEGSERGRMPLPQYGGGAAPGGYEW